MDKDNSCRALQDYTNRLVEFFSKDLSESDTRAKALDVFLRDVQDSRADSGKEGMKDGRS